MKKYKDIQILHENKHLNFYHMDALTDSGREFDYYFVSRNKLGSIEAVTGKNKAEGIVIYPIFKDSPGKIVLIKQYRYPLGDYLYELPAGLIDSGENADEAAVREMREETGYDFTPYNGGNAFFRRPFYMGAGYTDEASSAVFGYVSGKANEQKTEDTESIQVIIADREMAKDILEHGKMSLRCAYLLINFINSADDNPFSFLG